VESGKRYIPPGTDVPPGRGTPVNTGRISGRSVSAHGRPW